MSIVQDTFCFSRSWVSEEEFESEGSELDGSADEKGKHNCCF